MVVADAYLFMLPLLILQNLKWILFSFISLIFKHTNNNILKSKLALQVNKLQFFFLVCIEPGFWLGGLTVQQK